MLFRARAVPDGRFSAHEAPLSHPVDRRPGACRGGYVDFLPQHRHAQARKPACPRQSAADCLLRGICGDGDLVRSLRSALLLPVCSPAQKKNLFPILMISFMINNILPARMGEAARAMLLWKRNGYSGAVSVGSIILERILDTVVYMSTFFIPVFFVPGLAGSSGAGGQARALTMQTVALAFCAGFVLFAVLLAAYSRFPTAVRALGVRIASAKFVPDHLRSRINRIGKELIPTLNGRFPPGVSPKSSRCRTQSCRAMGAWPWC